MLPWIRHLLLLLLVTHTISANKTDKGVDLVEYYKKNKEVSPLEILLQDDKFLRENAEKHGYINGEWAALLSDSTTTTPCSKNPRLNNPDCIKNEKHSYISSPDDSRNTQKYEDKYNYDGPRVSPTLAHTDRYILGKRTKENFRHQELDTTINRNIIATERGTEIEPAQNVDDKTQKTDDRITTENTFENQDEINYFTIEQNKPLHELDGAEPYNQLTQKVPFYWKEPIQTEYGQPNHVPSHGSPSQADQFEYTQNSKLTPPSNSVYGGNTQDHHHLKSMQPSNDSLEDSIPKEKKTNLALLHRINKDTQRNSQSHATPELNGNENAPAFFGKDNVNSNIHKEQTHSNIDSSSEDTNTAPLTRELYGTIGSTVNRNFDDLGNVSSEHDSSGPPELKKTDSEETKINTPMENEINGEVANSNVTFSTKGNSADPYGRVDNNSISSADANQRNHHSSNALEGTDKNLMNETKSSQMKLPTERPHTQADLYGRADSENINNDSSQKHNDISFATERTSDEPVNYYNVSSNYSDSNNTPSRNEEQKYENISQIIKPKSDTVDVYDVGNKSDKSLAHPSLANGVVVESRQNKTPQNQMVESHNVQSEAGAYGLVEPTSLNTQNTTRKGDFFSPANNGSFSDRDQQFQKPESTEIIEKTHAQNATGPYGLTDSTNNVNNTLRENGVSSSEMPPDDTVQAYSNETLVLQKQHETNPYGFVDPVTVGSNNDNQENSFNPFTTKPSLDTQLHQETESKTFTNPELGPYGLVDTESVSTNLKPEETRNILSGVDASSIEPAYKKFNNSLNLNYQNVSIPQQNVSNEISNKTKDALQNGKKIGPYVSDAGTAMSEPILNNSENNDDELSQGEENPTSGAAQPTFKILHHAKVGNYSSKQPKVLEGTIPKNISENGTNIWASPDEDKKHSADIITNNASKTENADGQLTTPDAENKRTLVSYTADEAQPNRSLFILESPVQLCFCDSGKPVKGFRLIPF